MSSSLLNQILDANRSYLAGTPRVLESGGPAFVVVTCSDSRLTGLLEPAMGLPRHRAHVVRTAGGRIVAEDHAVLRTVVAGVFVKGATEVFVVGHTGCAMAELQIASVAESFRRAGVPRSAFGDVDLRAWFGALGSVREGVIESVTWLRRCALLPKGFPVHGLIIDSESGGLESLVEEAAQPPSVAVPTGVEAPAPAPAASRVRAPAAETPPSPPPAPPASRPAVIPAAGSGAPAGKPYDSLIDAARALATVIQRERGNPNFQQELLELRMAVQREKNPLNLLALLERTADRYKARHPELSQVVAYFRNAVTSREGRDKELVEQFQRILR